jgi:hypothetical protein
MDLCDGSIHRCLTKNSLCEVDRRQGATRIQLGKATQEVAHAQEMEARLGTVLPDGRRERANPFVRGPGPKTGVPAVHFAEDNMPDHRSRGMRNQQARRHIVNGASQALERRQAVGRVIRRCSVEVLDNRMDGFLFTGGKHLRPVILLHVNRPRPGRRSLGLHSSTH